MLPGEGEAEGEAEAEAEAERLRLRMGVRVGWRPVLPSTRTGVVAARVCSSLCRARPAWVASTRGEGEAEGEAEAEAVVGEAEDEAQVGRKAHLGEAFAVHGVDDVHDTVGVLRVCSGRS